VTIECPKCKTKNPDETAFCGKCGTNFDSDLGPTQTMETHTKELTTGSTFAGRYQIIEELGRGGMGQVYKAVDVKIKEKVALKLIKSGIASDKKTLERFSHELKTARKISHKNVGRMYEIMEDKGLHFITMEYVSGQDLKGLIRQSAPLSVSRTIKITKQICDGLAEAHRLGVVHRDLKPSNIMIDRDGDIKIMDFGIARSLKEKGITGAGVMIGTPEYMSPEQVEAKDVDQRSDVYSLGIILYEMTTGQLPFEGDTALAVAMKHKGEMPKDPKEFNSQLSDDLNRVILTCLEKEKENRYQSAGEVRSALENIEQGLPTTERKAQKSKPITSKEITVSFNVKKYLIPVILTTVLVLAVLLIWHPWKKKTILLPSSEKPSLAVLYFENNTGDENLEYLRSGLSEWLITDLSQSRFLNVISGDKIYSSLKRLNLLENAKYSTEDLTKVAELVYADHVLKGSYIKVGDNFVITAMLQKPGTSEMVSSIQARCLGEEEIPEKVDELTRKIKQDLALSPQQIAADIDHEVGKITTNSLEAFKLYSEGRNLHHETEYRKSIEKMEKAIEIDPQFAMAFRSMGVSYNNMLLFSEATKFHRKAFELKDRLSDRERYLIEGEFYREREATYAEAIESYSKLLELYPDDPIGNTNFGIIYHSIEEYDKAARLYKVLTQGNDPSPFSVMNLANVYRAQGLYDKALNELEYYRDNITDNAVIHGELSDHYFLQGKFELAMAECEKAISLNPDGIHYKIRKGRIAQCQGDLRTAEEIYREVLESKELGWHLYVRVVLGTLHALKGQFSEVENQFHMAVELAEKLDDKWWEATARTMLAFTQLRTGEPERALTEVEMAWEAGVAQESQSWQERALFLKGLSFVGMNDMVEAEKTAEELRKFIENGMNSKLIRDYYYLQGMMEMEKGHYSQAVDLFERAKRYLYQENSFGPFDCDQTLFADPRALAYFQMGDLEQAKEEYERIQSIITGRLYYGDVYVRSFYMLGKIHEEQGKKAKAIENYEKFLDLWKDADPGFPEVEDVKKRLAELKQ